MKKIILILIAIAAVTTSCKKDEDKLAGKWEVKSFFINDVDCTIVYQEKCGCNIGFNYERTTKVSELTNCKPDSKMVYGHYSLNKETNKKKLKTTYNEISSFDTVQRTFFGPIGPLKSTDWEILRLTNDEMKLESSYEGNEYTIEFTKYEN